MSLTKGTGIEWKPLIKRLLEAFIAIYVATLSAGIYFTHEGFNWQPLSIVMIFLYVFIFFTAIRHALVRLPIAGIMIFTPLAPLALLIIVVTMIPILQWLQ